MTLDATKILDTIISHALASGLFEAVNSYEPRSAPASRLSAAVWLDSLAPAVGSGLATTSARLVYNVRVYTGMLSEPQDAIDPAILSAVDVLVSTYSGDLELGSQVRCVDLLGMAGVPLSAQAGYINQDGRMYRVMTILLPLIVNDVWNQVP